MLISNTLPQQPQQKQLLVLCEGALHHSVCQKYDNATTFTSEEVGLFLKKNSVNHLRTPSYHPASKGLVEWRSSKMVLLTPNCHASYSGTVSARIRKFVGKGGWGGVRGLGEGMLSIPKLLSKGIALGLSLLILNTIMCTCLLLIHKAMTSSHFSFNGRN